MKKKTALFITFCFLLLPAEAQDDGFSTFRERMLNNYNSFRNEVLEEYARYLDQVWIDLDNFICSLFASILSFDGLYILILLLLLFLVF